MTFGADLLIDVQYSEECRKIFGKEVWGLAFPDVICPIDEEQRRFLSELLADVFAEPDPMRQSVFFSLLPAEILVNGRYISIEYRNLKGAHYDHDRRLMAVLTDVTETRQLQSQLEQDRLRLKMVVKAVTNYNDLAEAVRDYQLFCGAGMGQIIESDQSVAGIIGEILRRVHTFKRRVRATRPHQCRQATARDGNPHRRHALSHRSDRPRSPDRDAGHVSHAPLARCRHAGAHRHPRR